MIYYKTKEEIELVRQSALLVARTLGEVAGMMIPGMDTASVDKRAEEFIRDNGGVPAFKGYNGFPSTLCVSVNEQVVHGFPSKDIMKEGDIVSLDCGVLMNGFFGDSAYTFPIGEISEDTKKLLRITKECLYLAIEKAIIGNRLGDLSHAIQEHAEKNGFGVVRELVGHGIGKDLHEKPEVANYGKKGSGIVLKEGLVIAVEPMINQGKRHVKQLNDGWTIVTGDKKPSAHYEHTLTIGKEKADVLSSFEFIEEKLNNISR